MRGTNFDGKKSGGAMLRGLRRCEGADPDVVRAAYRTLAKKYHPDAASA
jgi:curved DNA-binding protein CbpA